MAEQPNVRTRQILNASVIMERIDRRTLRRFHEQFKDWNPEWGHPLDFAPGGKHWTPPKNHLRAA